MFMMSPCAYTFDWGQESDQSANYKMLIMLGYAFIDQLQSNLQCVTFFRQQITLC